MWGFERVPIQQWSKIIGCITQCILANFQISQMRETVKKRGTFLHFLYFITYRCLKKEGHMVKSLSFLFQNQRLSLQKRDSWQVCIQWHTCIIKWGCITNTKWRIMIVISLKNELPEYVGYANCTEYKTKSYNNYLTIPVEIKTIGIKLPPQYAAL